MAWSLSGTYLENCNCETVCPCTTSELTRPADEERCLVFFLFHVDEGEIEGTDVGDLNVAALFDTPQVMADGNWRPASSSTRRPQTSRSRSSCGFSVASWAVPRRRSPH
jgi:hypothetical protein